jgi:hypothetical protein
MSRPIFTSPPHSETEDPFRTLSTTFAAALLASGLLPYARAELNDSGNEVLFIFEDPLSNGDELKRRFDAGLFPRVDPKALFVARGFLMDEMSRLPGRGRNVKI